MVFIAVVCHEVMLLHHAVAQQSCKSLMYFPLAVMQFLKNCIIPLHQEIWQARSGTAAPLLFPFTYIPFPNYQYKTSTGLWERSLKTARVRVC